MPLVMQHTNTWQAHDPNFGAKGATSCKVRTTQSWQPTGHQLHAWLGALGASLPRHPGRNGPKAKLGAEQQAQNQHSSRVHRAHINDQAETLRY